MAHAHGASASSSSDYQQHFPVPSSLLHEDPDPLWPGPIKEWVGFEEAVRAYDPARRDNLYPTYEQWIPNQVLTKSHSITGLCWFFNTPVLSKVNELARDTIGATKVRLELYNPTGHTSGKRQPHFRGYSESDDQASHRLLGLIRSDQDQMIRQAFPPHFLEQTSIEQRRWLGELGLYLVRAKLRYGWLTTWIWTVFVELTIDDNGVGNLMVSKPVRFDSSISADSISVNAGLWYLMHITNGDGYTVDGYNEASTRAAAGTEKLDCCWD